MGFPARNPRSPAAVFGSFPNDPYDEFLVWEFAIPVRAVFGSFPNDPYDDFLGMGVRNSSASRVRVVSQRPLRQLEACGF
jgi:hypothetical protein